MERLKYGICLIGFNNVNGIKRLLASLARVDFCGDRDITLIASIDYSGNTAVEDVLREFAWEHGDKVILAYESNLGLRKHILTCGDYLEKYQLDAMVVLEDDIYVSPMMYRYVRQAVPFYKDDPRVAGISLYKHEFNIYAQHPFFDYADGGDTYFVQYAMSWGQVWLKDRWKEFKAWYDGRMWEHMDASRIPANLSQWKNSWLKFHIMYCIDRNLYFVYPRQGLTTDFTDVGTHHTQVTTAMQIPMCLNRKSDWVLNRLEDTYAVYDAFFENVRIGEFLGIEDLETDLYGVKPRGAGRYLLSRRELPYAVRKSWGLHLRPMEANIFLDLPGEQIFLYDLEVPAQKEKRQGYEDSLIEYDLKGLPVVTKPILKYISREIARKIKRRIRRG